MAGVKIRLNYAALAKLLKSEDFAALANSAAQQVADKAGDGAQVSKYTTDRRAAAVSVPAEDQARDGALTRAAAAVGLQVKTK